jgi:hypothetical protein
MNPQKLPTAVFVVLLIMVAVWFVLIKLLFSRIETAHPQKYEAMGRPSLFLRNNIGTGWVVMKFLVTREHKTLNDNYLSRLSDAMLLFFAIYLLLFIGIIFFALGPHAA